LILLAEVPFTPCKNEHDCRSLIGIALHAQPVLLRVAKIACLDEMEGDNMPDSDLNAAGVATMQKESLKQYLEEYLKEDKYISVLDGPSWVCRFREVKKWRAYSCIQLIPEIHLVA
jgi:hypothetical protein